MPWRPRPARAGSAWSSRRAATVTPRCGRWPATSGARCTPGRPGSTCSTRPSPPDAPLADLLGASIEHLAEGPDPVKAKVQDILGLSYDHFIQSVLLPQGRFADFLQAEPRKRQDAARRAAGVRRLQEDRAAGPGPRQAGGRTGAPRAGTTGQARRCHGGSRGTGRRPRPGTGRTRTGRRRPAAAPSTSGPNRPARRLSRPTPCALRPGCWRPSACRPGWRAWRTGSPPPISGSRPARSRPPMRPAPKRRPNEPATRCPTRLTWRRWLVHTSSSAPSLPGFRRSKRI